jgi:hypothetical protein
MSERLLSLLRHPFCPPPATAALYGLLCWLALRAADAINLCYHGDTWLAATGAALLLGALVLTAVRARRRGWRPATVTAVTLMSAVCITPVMAFSWFVAAFSACFTF